MKKKFIIPIILLLALSCSLSQNNQFRLGFTGMYPSYYDYNDGMGINWNYYHEMNTNLWQGWWVGNEWDHLGNGGTNSTVEVLQKLYSENIDGFFQPDTIRWAALGRVQINYAAATGVDTSFTYRDHWGIGQDVQDNGHWVRYYNANNTPGLVLSNVKENCMQSKNNNYDPKYQVSFPYNNYDSIPLPITPVSYLNWYHIKPRMRISAVEAFVDPPINVCKIIIKAFDGSTASEIDIKTNNFRDPTGYSYNGQYLEDYNQWSMSIRGDLLNAGRPDKFDLDSCKVDYQIYWYGTVSVYIDYVKVMDEAAYQLLTDLPDPNITYNQVRLAIQRKVNNISQHDARNHMRGFYLEEVDYSNLACIAYLNKILIPSIPNINPDNYKVIPLLNNVDSYTSYIKYNHNPNDNFKFYYDLFDSCNEKIFMFVRYPFVGSVSDPNGKLKLPSNINSNSLTFPASFPAGVAADVRKCYKDGISSVSNDTYNSDLQQRLETYEGYLKYVFNPQCQQHNMTMYCVPQIIFWHFHDQDGWMREPMTSEISAQIGIDLCNGAKGILPYSYESWYLDTNIINIKKQNLSINPVTGYQHDLSLGASDFNSNTNWGWLKRSLDVYGENKWDSLKALYAKMQVWGPILYNSTNTHGWSFATQGVDNNDFISEVLSFNPATQTFDAQYSQTFWEMGIVSPPIISREHSKYVLFCNRRCIPATTNPTYPGDSRVLLFLFNYFPESTNWIIKDVYTNQTMNISIYGYQNLGLSTGSLGWFNPGQTKLFKLTPVMQTGGTLICDDTISGDFNCEGTVYNNGYNITIDNNSSLHFTDTSTIVMNGGTFTSGSSSYSGPPNITIDAVNNNNFHGLQFRNCNVRIYNTIFTNLSNDTTFSINCIDCPVVDIRNCSFTYSNQQLNGSINITYYDSSNLPPNVYIGANTFNPGISTLPSINAMSYAAITTPVIIENNFFNGNQTGGYISIILSGITGGAIKTNTFTDCDRSMSFLSSSLDITGNTINSAVGNSKSIEGLSGSELRMTRAKGYFLGGLNNINNTGQSSSNIYLDNSYVIMDQGENIFKINDAQSWHLNGYFPELQSIPTSETDNCFYVNNVLVDPPDENVTWGQDSLVTFTFDPYMSNCSQSVPGGDMVINLGNNIYDTVGTYNGSGGSEMPNTPPFTKGGQGGFITLNAKQLYDSISIQMRYRNYTYVKTRCMDLINIYPDSIQSLNAISKLYLASSASDTSHAGRVALKTFYEGLILNHSYNLSLVNRCNYFVQKCKVLLHLYSDALAGFQAIMINNPYSYEGLVARWDYMATSLLMQGQGGGNPPNLSKGEEFASDVDNTNVDLNKLNGEYLNKEYPENDVLGDPQGPRDGSPWTKQERKNLRQAINNTFESSKSYQDKKITSLTKEAERGNEEAKRQLNLSKTIKEIVGAKDATGKTQKPKNILEHIKIVNSDIQKIIVAASGKKSNKPTVFIPTSFALYQNYPNPFNPVTKIMYDLPNAAKVKITVYDILGREVIKLVNNEFKQAGRYYVDFNGNNFASGVYFYKIEADKFVQAKKMILIK